MCLIHLYNILHKGESLTFNYPPGFDFGFSCATRYSLQETSSWSPRNILIQQIDILSDLDMPSIPQILRNPATPRLRKSRWDVWYAVSLRSRHEGGDVMATYKGESLWIACFSYAPYTRILLPGPPSIIPCCLSSLIDIDQAFAEWSIYLHYGIWGKACSDSLQGSLQPSMTLLSISCPVMDINI